mgnify:CR=1 FL=1
MVEVRHLTYYTFVIDKVGINPPLSLRARTHRARVGSILRLVATDIIHETS